METLRRSQAKLEEEMAEEKIWNIKVRELLCTFHAGNKFRTKRYYCLAAKVQRRYWAFDSIQSLSFELMQTEFTL